MSDMRRREFITLGAGVATWPLAARAMQGERMRRIGVLMAVTERDPESQFRVNAFEAGLRELGWVAGRNLRIEYRWAPDPDLLHHVVTRGDAKIDYRRLARACERDNPNSRRHCHS